MMLSFSKFVKKYIKEDDVAENAEHTAILRANAPTLKHIEFGRAIKAAADEEGANHTVYVTRSQDPKKNPLTPEQKMKYLTAAAPDVNWQLVPEDAPNIMGILSKMYQRGVTRPVIHGDNERAEQFSQLANAYNGVETGKDGKPLPNYYRFPNQIEVRQFGATRLNPGTVTTNPTADDQISGTNLRNAIKTGNRNLAHSMMPPDLSPEMKDQMMVDVLHGMHPPNPEPKTKPRAKKVR